jgi:NTP pyrophosphatase (non-canonical NTP hydrolase)
MDLNEYQNKAMATCLPTCDNVSYMLMNLVGEVGELASKIAKDIRKGNVVIGHGVANELIPLMPFDEWFNRQEEYKKELGDIMWQAAGLARVMGWDLESVCQGNLDKLASRQIRGKIDGEGDNR